jgi:hypothetical protein
MPIASKDFGDMSLMNAVIIEDYLKYTIGITYDFYLETIDFFTGCIICFLYASSAKCIPLSKTLL